MKALHLPKFVTAVASVLCAITLQAQSTTLPANYTTDELGHIIAPLPYLTSFDNTYQEYTGKSLPCGWDCSGDTPFVTANLDEIPASDGTYYAISPNNDTFVRNERLYSVFFHMEAGKEYTISFDLWMAGYEAKRPTFALTIGEEQDYDFQTQLITTAGVKDNWQKVTGTYTPAATGNYCFCFAFNSTETFTGSVCIDNVIVSYDGALLPTTADIAYNGLFSLMDNTLVTMAGGTVPFTGISTYATEHHWTVVNKNGKPIYTCDERNAEIAFPESGEYTVILTAANAAHRATASKKVNVTFVGAEQTLWSPLQTYSDATVSYYQSGKTPYFAGSEGDYVTGPNHFYHRFAERVVMPENVSMSLQTLNYFVCNRTFADVTSGMVEREKPFTFTVYGEKDGKLDENTIFFRKETKLGEAFASGGGGMGAPDNVATPLNGTTQGTFYVAFEFPADVTIETTGGNRTYVELMANHHNDGHSTLYYFSDALQEWYPIDNLNPGLAGTGLQLVIWGTVNVGIPAGISQVTNDSAAASATLYNICGQRVTNTTTRGLYILNGKKILR